MRRFQLVFALFAVMVLGVPQAWASTAGPVMSSDQALNLLKEGNDRFVSGSLKRPNQDQARRSLTASKGQQPFATVISCSDSRVPVEMLFDSGIGDIFIVRVAGNVADVDEIGTMEYGVDHLVTPLLVVLGHTRCGAVTAVVQGAELHGSLPLLVDNIKPAVEKARAANPGATGDALVNEAIKANVWQVIEDTLKKSEIVQKRVKGGDLKIVGALYDIETGKITWMGPHPDQDKLIAK